MSRSLGVLAFTLCVSMMLNGCLTSDTSPTSPTSQGTLRTRNFTVENDFAHTAGIPLARPATLFLGTDNSLVAEHLELHRDLFGKLVFRNRYVKLTLTEIEPGGNEIDLGTRFLHIPDAEFAENPSQAETVLVRVAWTTTAINPGSEIRACAQVLKKERNPARWVTIGEELCATLAPEFEF